MNAKAMFDFANYELEKETGLELVYSHRIYPHSIYFNKHRRRVTKYTKKMVWDIYEYTVVSETITMSELKAINKQVEELGWTL